MTNLHKEDWDLPPRSRPGTVALALGCGGARGYAHIGALEEIEALGLPIAGIAGGSIGAIIGSLYALGASPAELVALQIGPRIRRAIRPQLRRDRLLDPTPLVQLIEQLIGNATFEQTRIPLAITAADLRSYTRVVLREGLVSPAVTASIMVAGVLPPHRVHDMWLSDPGTLEGLPLDVAMTFGADLVVGVSGDLSSGAWANRMRHRLPLRRLLEPLAGLLDRGRAGKFGSLRSALATQLRAAGRPKPEVPLPASVILVQPDFGGMSANNFWACDRARMLGAEALRQVTPTILTALGQRAETGQRR